ncbi:hypothetical protein GCM10010520_23230 [Rhizobium viscosum]
MTTVEARDNFAVIIVVTGSTAIRTVDGTGTIATQALSHSAYPDGVEIA